MPFIDDTAHAFLPYPDVPVPHAPAGTLAGLSFGVKDLFDVAGYPTGGGQPLVLAMSGIKTKTAPAVQKLLYAGARFVGKTVTDELAFSMNGNNAHFGAPINGAAAGRIAGGSSSGSASAVSNNLCDFALGSDTGGSVRAPANHCGLYGIRPTHGRISLDGVLDLSPSLDTCGYFARDVDTFTRVSAVLLGEDTAPLPTSFRLLKPLDIWAMLDDEVLTAQAAPLARVEAALGKAAETRVFLDDPDTAYWSFRYIQGHEAWVVNGPFIERYCPPLGPGIAERFAWSKTVTDAQLAAATSYRERFKKHLTDLLGSDGVLVMPTVADIAPLISDSGDRLESYRNRSIQMLCLAGLSGFPQISLPLGQRLGAPLGLSLLGPAGSDMGLVRLAQSIMKAT
ncbi:amidase [Polaromonas sp. YR568]|uniref:amidase n=1 Tax=Polaromonas sp. YR568 TaxID=1855301 RepID=UPI00313784DB